MTLMVFLRVGMFDLINAQEESTSWIMKTKLQHGKIQGISILLLCSKK